MSTSSSSASASAGASVVTAQRDGRADAHGAAGEVSLGDGADPRAEFHGLFAQFHAATALGAQGVPLPAVLDVADADADAAALPACLAGRTTTRLQRDVTTDDDLLLLLDSPTVRRERARPRVPVPARASSRFPVRRRPPHERARFAVSRRPTRSAS